MPSGGCTISYSVEVLVFGSILCANGTSVNINDAVITWGDSPNTNVLEDEACLPTYPDLQIDKRIDNSNEPNPVYPGNTVTYTLQLRALNENSSVTVPINSIVDTVGEYITLLSPVSPASPIYPICSFNGAGSV